MTMLSPGSLSQPVIFVQSSSQGQQVRPPNYLIILTYINVNAEHKEKAQVTVQHLEQCLVSTKCPSIKARVFHSVLSAIWIVLFWRVYLILKQSLAMWPRLSWNTWSTCLSLPSTGIILIIYWVHFKKKHKVIVLSANRLILLHIHLLLPNLVCSCTVGLFALLFYFYIYFYSLEIIVHCKAVFGRDRECVTSPFLVLCFEVNTHSPVIPTADARAEVKGEFTKRYLLSNQTKLLCRAKDPFFSPWECSTKRPFKILIMYLYECRYFETI